MEANLSNSPSSFVDQSVVPGDVVLDLSSMANQTIKLGGGLHQDCDAISVMKAGKLKFVKPNKCWVKSSQRRHREFPFNGGRGIIRCQWRDSRQPNQGSLKILGVKEYLQRFERKNVSRVSWYRPRFHVGKGVGFKGGFKVTHLGPDNTQNIVNLVGKHKRGLTDAARGLGYVESEVGLMVQEFAQPNPGGSASGKPSNTNPDLSRVFALLRDKVGCCPIVNALGVSVEDTPLHERVVGGRPVGMSPSSGSTITGSRSYHARLHQVGAMTEGQSHDEGGFKDRGEAVDTQTKCRLADVADELALVVRPEVPCNEEVGVDVREEDDVSVTEIEKTEFHQQIVYLVLRPTLRMGKLKKIGLTFILRVGTLIYVRVAKANTGMNPELSCTDATGKAAECGPLKDGFTFESLTGLAQMLLSSATCPVLEGLGKKLSFEIAVGLNGRVWVNVEAPSTVILVSNAIMNSESLSGVQQKIMVEKLLQRFSIFARSCDENMMWLEIHKIEDAPFGGAMTSTFHSQEERYGVKEEVDIY
ncbi:hypothetical protein TEA_002526 [Camellia sinensis var. sinensis]|uniref:K Homology domain-containing protein n=1 Tax=Camellia sinensis var. sinensis TaxID=542762 RepID=A0A4S4D5G2_CAMSN|nr:hypothetical protein TEA_002526 [Camellia sinensis var. sinensis]